MPRWTEESRRRQAENARKNKPWEHSTGPRTAAGKARSSQNALRHGLCGRYGETIRTILFHNRKFMQTFKDLRDVQQLKGDRMFWNELNKIQAESKGIPPPPGENPGTK